MNVNVRGRERERWVFAEERVEEGENSGSSSIVRG